MKPLLLLDIDGPLNPWAAPSGTMPDGYLEHAFRLSRWGRKRLRMRLNPTHGPTLLAIAERTGAELAWATTWEHQANTMVGPAIGLPNLRVVEFETGSSAWKYPAVARYARDRPLAWLDDDFDLYPGPRDEFTARRTAPTLLHRVSPRVGITDDDLSAVEAWLAAG